jgi:hypothetical protein
LPITNFTTSKEIKIGKVRIFAFTQETSKSIEDYLKELFKNNTDYKDDEAKTKIIKNMFEPFVAPLVGKACAEVVLSGREKTSHERALDEITKALSLLKLYCDIDNTLGQYFGLEGESNPSTVRMTLAYRIDGTGFSPSLERVGTLVPFDLNEKRLNIMNENGFQKLANIFNKEVKDKLDTRILTSVNWYGKAYDVQTSRSKGNVVEVEMIKLGDKLVKITTAIESLLVFNEQELITNSVSERTATLLALNKEKFDEIRKFMSGMYSARSAVVHHGEVSFTKTDLDKFQFLVRNTVIVLLKNLDVWQIKTENDFFYWIEKERMEFKFNKHPDIS